MTKHELLTAIEKEIDNLPPIPENITKIKNLIHDPTSDSHSIATYVKLDPSLTANLLRIANSAWYAVRSRIDNVERAITTIGLKQLSNILMTIGAKKVIEDRYMAMEDIWEHSYKCAFYSQSIMKMHSKKNDDLENAYTVGLLHDIGKVILLATNPTLMDKIEALSQKKKMSVAVIEKLSLGLSHAEIGQKLMENWNFPEHISKPVGYHHAPKLVDPEYQTLTYTVYIANTLSHQTLDTISDELMEEIEPQVLTFFKLENKDDLRKLFNSLEQFYNKVGKKLRNITV